MYVEVMENIINVYFGENKNQKIYQRKICVLPLDLSYNLWIKTFITRRRGIHNQVYLV